MNVRVALAQVDVVLGDVDANLAIAREAIQEARSHDADLIIFPELHLCGYSVGGVDNEVGMAANDPRLAELSKYADGADIVVGFAEPSKTHTYYNSVAYLSGGEVLHVHRKLYLPTYAGFEERKHFSPGQSMRAFDTRFGRMALLLCNDAWQPQLAFIAVYDGATVLISQACSAERSDPQTGGDFSDDWLTICTFHARFSQAYMIFVNRVGNESGRQFWGGSMVVDPTGAIVGNAPRNDSAIKMVDIDIANVAKARRALPLVKEARLAVIGREIDRLLADGGDA